MARPEVEWPIPVYVTELRERVVVTCRVAPRALAGRVLGPLALETLGGEALVSLALGNGRCLKSVGGAALAGEFRLAELITPVRWQGACRPALRGQYLLGLLCDSPGVRRLLRAALDCDSSGAVLDQGGERGGYACCIREVAGTSACFDLSLPQVREDERWPGGSVFTSPEAAEAHLLHPECYFVAERTGRLVRAVPIHQYARATTHLLPRTLDPGLIAAALDLSRDQVIVDHVLFQKRCTHTWAFPPETIPVPRRLPEWVRAGVGECASL